MSNDKSIYKYATHLVYLTSANSPDEIEEKIIFSLLKKQPKRADVYWFVHVDVTDSPHSLEYTVKQILPGKMIRIDLKMGFREIPQISKLFRKVVDDLQDRNEVEIVSRYATLHKHNIAGDFRFIVMKKFMAKENELPFFESIVMDAYFLLRKMSLSEEKAFGLDTSSVKVEHIPVLIAPPKDFYMERKK